MTTREQFEEWYTQGSFQPTRIEGGHYESAAARLTWDAWQASRAAALEEAAKECEMMQKHFDTQDAIDAAEQCALAIRELKD